MPEPVRRKSRRLTPWRFAARSLISFRRASYSFCCGDCGGGTNSSFEAIRVGMGAGASACASSSHWRRHIDGVLLRERNWVEEGRIITLLYSWSFRKASRERERPEKNHHRGH